MSKIYFKPKVSKTKKPLKLLVVLVRPAYNIKTGLKRILKAKVQFREQLILKNIVIYTLYLKFKKNKGLVGVLFIF